MFKRVAPHFWAVFWNLFATALIAAFVAVGGWYQAVLKSAQHSGVHLEPLAMAVASIPTFVVLVVLSATGFVLAVIVSLIIVRRSAAPASTPPETEAESDLRYLLQQAQGETDLARRARDGAQRELKAASEQLREAKREMQSNSDSALRQEVQDLQASRESLRQELNQTKTLLAQHRFSTGIIKEVPPSGATAPTPEWSKPEAQSLRELQNELAKFAGQRDAALQQRDVARQQCDAAQHQRDTCKQQLAAAQKQRDSAIQERDNLQIKLAAAKALIEQSRIHLHISRVALDTRSGFARVLVAAVVTNYGVEGAVHDWQIFVTLPGGRTIQAMCWPAPRTGYVLYESHIQQAPLGAFQQPRLFEGHRRENYLSLATDQKKIKRGDHIEGVLIAEFPAISTLSIESLHGVTLRCFDYKNEPHEATAREALIVTEAIIAVRRYAG